MQKKHKLYCYVDETGQDTLGKLFVVAVVITDERHRELELILEQIEASSGKYQRKWLKTRDKERKDYIKALATQNFQGTVFTKTYTHGFSTKYDELEVLAVAQAVAIYREGHKIASDNYKVTVVIDGSSKATGLRMGSEFRKLGVRTHKVIGKKDESSPLIRLADAMAGLVREAYEGRRVYKSLRQKLARDKDKLYEI
jgi:hypothetical protein